MWKNVGEKISGSLAEEIRHHIKGDKKMKKKDMAEDAKATKHAPHSRETALQFLKRTSVLRLSEISVLIGQKVLINDVIIYIYIVSTL